MNKKIVCVALILIFATMGSCERKAVGNKADTSKRVELIMWVLGDEPPLGAEVLANLNQQLIQKLNCTLKINYLSWADFGAGMYTLLFVSGDVFDMVYTANWLNWSGLARRNAFMALDDLWPTYAPLNYARQSPTALKQSMVDGKLYIIPTLSATYSAFGLIYRADVAVKHGWDGKMESIADIEPYLAIVKANNPGIEPFDVYNEGSVMDDMWMASQGLYSIRGATNDFLFIDPSDPNPKIFAYYEDASIPEFLAMMSRWNNAGYFSKSALSDTDSEKLANGKAALKMHNLAYYEGAYKNNPPDWDMRWLNLVKDVSMTFNSDAIAISTTSRNPERALMLWDLLTNDEEAYRAFYFGIEGKTYSILNIDGKEYVEQLDPVGFDFSNCWAVMTSEFALAGYGGPPGTDLMRESYRAQIQEGVGTQKYRSFVIDTSSIETEYASCENAHRTYWYPLELGFVDQHSGLRNYESRMKAAGIDRVKSVLQEQLDAYVKDN